MISRRHGPSRRICVAAGGDDLTAVAALLAGLPQDSYGQAFLVRPDAGRPEIAGCPPRLMISWQPSAAQAAAAMAGWLAEWGEAGPDLRPTVWVGASISELILDLDLHCLDLYGLQAAGAGIEAPTPYVGLAPEPDTL